VRSRGINAKRGTARLVPFEQKLPTGWTAKKSPAEPGKKGMVVFLGGIYFTDQVGCQDILRYLFKKRR
jgi:hypothetical protein